MVRKNRIAAKFAELRNRGEAALIPFIFAGDPSLDQTLSLVQELEARGADLLELGVPFSDPMADGPANQRAGARALAAGASLPAILDLVGEIRRQSEIPIVLFGYFNPFLRYGCDRLCADAAHAGADGLLAVDLPPEENAELRRPARRAGLDLIYLLAPTTPLERSRRIARMASGFLYYVSITGVTGSPAALGPELRRRIDELRPFVSLPIGVGFGISTPEQARDVASYADAVVVGSALSRLLETHGASTAGIATVGELVSAMKRAMWDARKAAVGGSAG